MWWGFPLRCGGRPRGDSGGVIGGVLDGESGGSGGVTECDEEASLGE